MMLLHKYPKLEHFHWSRTMRSTVLNELKTFFELNSHVRSFGTDMITLCMNQNLFNDLQVKLDDLIIENIKHFRPYQIIIDQHHFSIVNQLYGQNSFKRLHYDMNCFDQQMIGQIASLQPLKSLRMDNYEIDGGIVNLPAALIGLVELEIGRSGGLFDTNNLAHQLINLKRIHFGCTSFQTCLPFLRYSVNLTKIKIDEVRDNEYNCNQDVLDIAALNEERKQLEGARKVTIFIDERVYLATKWAINGMEFDLIELRRTSSHELGAINSYRKTEDFFY